MNKRDLRNKIADILNDFYSDFRKADSLKESGDIFTKTVEDIIKNMEHYVTETNDNG